MTEKTNHLYTDNTKTLQIPYKEYVDLTERAKEGQRCMEIKEKVLADLSSILGESRPNNINEPSPLTSEVEKSSQPQPPSKPSAEKEIVEELTNEPETQVVQDATPEPTAPVQRDSKQTQGEAPPIKKDVAEYFNKVDGSGRLFNIFKQYYTCMNDSCDGPVRVTIKDGICSIWNYDEWEEFAFVDIFEGRLRIGVQSRYLTWLESLDLCEVPRLLTSRYNLICVQVDDLNQTVLDTLVTAFGELKVTT